MPQGTVKWFNGKKGYGFIGPLEGGKDVFVHIIEVQLAGLVTLFPGQRVKYAIGVSTRQRICAINLIAGPPPGDTGLDPYADDAGKFGDGTGFVKWFDEEKGFGFIQPYDGGAAVFFHRIELERAGLRCIERRDELAYDLHRNWKGKIEAVNLRRQ